MTVRLVPEKRTRAPFALDCSPAPSSITPALTSSSLYFTIAASISSDGILPASESLLAFTITMKRIGLSPLGSVRNRAAGRFRPVYTLALPSRRARVGGIDRGRQKILRQNALN